MRRKASRLMFLGACDLCEQSMAGINPPAGVHLRAHEPQSLGREVSLCVRCIRALSKAAMLTGGEGKGT